MRIHDQLLDVNIGIAEGFLRFRPRARETPCTQADFVVRRAHPATAAAGDGLDHDRISRSLRAILSASASVSTMPSLPGVTGTPALRAAGAGGVLVAHRAHRSWRAGR